MPKAIFNISYTTAEPPASYTGERRAEYIAERNFYNLTADYNYFTYTLDGRKVSKNANAEHYFTREGTNTGLFNMDGLLSEEKKADLKAQLKDTKSPIWHGFISFDDKTSLNFQNQENCVKFMRQTFGAFLKRAGFSPDNVELFCSLHDDTDHRHIHFAFFEKEPLHCNKNGKVGVFHRGLIGQKAIDDYLISANMHLSEHGAEYYTARDRAAAELRRVRETRSRTGRFTAAQAQKEENLILTAAFEDLCAKLPRYGRLQYNSDDMRHFRPEIDALAELLIHSDERAKAAYIEMQKQFGRVKGETEELVRDNKLAYINGRRMSGREIEDAMHGARNQKTPLEYLDPQSMGYFTRLQEDYKARIGNVVLGICKDMKKEKRRRARVNARHLKIEARLRRQHRGVALRLATDVLTEICNRESSDFLKSVKQLEYESKAEEIRVSGELS